MKLRDLFEQLNSLNMDLYGNWDVVIERGAISIGPLKTIGIKSIAIGFDWDEGKIIINPEEKMTEC